jgi:hypothetical protein
MTLFPPDANRCFGVVDRRSDAQYVNTPVTTEFDRIWLAGASITCGRLLNGSQQLLCWYVLLPYHTILHRLCQ